MSVLRLVLADQLSPSISALADADRNHDVLLLCEVMEEATYVPHHPQKIAFLFSAMRHFAAERRAEGWQVRYVALDAPGNTGSFDGEVARAVAELRPARVVCTRPGEYRVLCKMQGWQAALGVPVELREDDRFLCSEADFAAWAQGRKQWRLEFFYRWLRQRHGVLLDLDGGPAGGQWNFDHDNREPAPATLAVPPRLQHPRSATTAAVLALVQERFSTHFGALEPFTWGVTRAEALADWQWFLTEALPLFGTYQDAMLHGEVWLFHSRVSVYLNAGLLLPRELIEAAEQAWRTGAAPLNAVEGFIRQILGWREYVRGLYWLRMPAYAELNFLEAMRPLPASYWGGPTGMRCLAEAVRHTRDHAYSHHIQRLMVTGNFALLAGLDVKEVQAWYLAVYADAYEWVELPNTLGMALFGDGGVLASKPYAASGRYLDRMSNYCTGCRYDPAAATGERACPFTTLYWDFLARHAERLGSNPRLSYAYANWRRFPATKQQAIRAEAVRVFERLQEGTL